MVNAWYEPEPANDSYVPTINHVGTALAVVVGAVGAACWIYVARVCRRPL